MTNRFQVKYEQNTTSYAPIEVYQFPEMAGEVYIQLVWRYFCYLVAANWASHQEVASSGWLDADIGLSEHERAVQALILCTT